MNILKRSKYPTELHRRRYSLSCHNRYESLDDPHLDKFFRQDGKQKDLTRMFLSERQIAKTATSLEKSKSKARMQKISKHLRYPPQNPEMMTQSTSRFIKRSQKLKGRDKVNHTQFQKCQSQPIQIKKSKKNQHINSDENFRKSSIIQKLLKKQQIDQKKVDKKENKSYQKFQNQYLKRKRKSIVIKKVDSGDQDEDPQPTQQVIKIIKTIWQLSCNILLSPYNTKTQSSFSLYSSSNYQYDAKIHFMNFCSKISNKQLMEFIQQKRNMCLEVNQKYRIYDISHK